MPGGTIKVLQLKINEAYGKSLPDTRKGARQQINKKRSKTRFVHVYHPGTQIIPAGWPTNSDNRNSGRANPEKPKTVPHIIWDGCRFRRETPEPPRFWQWKWPWYQSPTLNSCTLQRAQVSSAPRVVTCWYRRTDLLKLTRDIKDSQIPRQISRFDQLQVTWHNGWLVTHKRRTIRAHTRFGSKKRVKPCM